MRLELALATATVIRCNREDGCAQLLPDLLDHVTNLKAQFGSKRNLYLSPMAGVPHVARRYGNPEHFLQAKGLGA